MTKIDNLWSNKDSLMDRLFLHELAGPLAKAEAEVKFVENFQIKGSQWEINPTEQTKALMKELKIKDINQLKQWRQLHKLTDEKKFKDFVEYRAKKRIVIQEILKNVGKSLYLRYKDRLDRVLYSLIRVESEELAYKLYYEIDAKEKEFGDIASEYSCGPEAKTQGIIGPVDLTTPHPEVAARLRTASARQLFPPFRADQWHTIIRLEYRFESEYNEQTRQFLGGLLLGSKTAELTKTISEQFMQEQ